MRGLSGSGRYPDMRASCAFHYHQRRHRHHDAAYRDARCGSVSVSISLFSRPRLPISLSRDTSYECMSPSLSLHLSLHLRVSHLRTFIAIRLVSYFARTNFFLRGDYVNTIETAPINVDMPSLGSVDKFSSRMSSRTSWGSPYDRILNRDDLDDAFECIPTSARLFIAWRSYLVLELILGASNVGNKVPHPVQRPTSLLTCLYFYHIYLIYRFIPTSCQKECR